MDKYEYKIRSQEIRDLIAQGEYAAAVEIADTIDWRRVKSVMMLCTISDLYKINRRFEESNEILLLAYNRHPNGRTIVYSLCELAIKMEEFVQAIEYYKEFVQIAPKDTGRYVLQYKLYVAQEVSLEERIEVLEELKKRDYREKWAYELAYLYHRVGLATRCVEECDELILWFGEGKYVTKAMELKMLHQPLTPEQQAKYEGRFEEYQMEQEAAQKVKFQSVDEDNPIDVMNAPTVEIPSGEIADIQVKTVDVGEYNTINLQKELADSMRELWTETPQNKEEEQIPVATEEYFTAQTGELGIVQEEIISEEPALEEQNVIEQVTVFEEAYYEEAKDDNVDTNDENDENDEGVSVLSSTQKITQAIVAPLFLQTGNISEVAVLLDEEQEPVGEEVSDEGQELDEEPLSDEKQELDEELLSDEKKESDEEEDLVEELQFEPEESQFEPNIPKHREFDDTEQKKTPRPVLKRPEAFDKYLGMEYDGQMSFVLPDADKVEKQITGQLNIEDILAEWERMKKENEQKQAEEVRQLVLQHTGNILVDFDQMTRDSLLEELENSNNEQTAEYEEADVFQQIIAREEAELEELRAEEIEAGVEETGSEEIYFEPENEQEEVAEPVEEAGADTLNVEITEIEEVEEIAEIEEIEEPEEIEEIQEIEEAEEPEEIEEIQEIEETEEPEEIEELQEIEEIEETEAVRGIVETGYADSGEADSSVNVEDFLQKIDSNIRDAVSDANPRDLTDEEMELYASYAQDRKTKEQLVKAIDSISLAPYTGNVVITGEEGMDTLGLAKSMMKEVQMMDSNFSGKIAKISGSSMNQRDMAKVISKLNNGALIIENADKMTVETANSLHRALQQENMGIVVIMEGGKKAITKLLEAVPRLGDSFNARINIEALDNDSLVAYGKKYAKEQEYVIDEMGLLALHTRISDRQTSDHSVTLMEVKEIVDEAIVHANKKNIRHFFDVLFAKRYDEEDMIILRENDFI